MSLSTTPSPLLRRAKKPEREASQRHCPVHHRRRRCVCAVIGQRVPLAPPFRCLFRQLRNRELMTPLACSSALALLLSSLFGGFELGDAGAEVSGEGVQLGGGRSGLLRAHRVLPDTSAT